MPKKGITQKEVMISIEALLQKGEVPTAMRIRHQLKRGSLTTIQKYFRAWKLDTFKNCSKAREIISGNTKIMISEDRKAMGTLKEMSIALETQMKTLSQELIKKEQENLKINQQNIQLTENLKELSEAHKGLLIKFEDLNKSYQDLKLERENSLQKILEDKNKQIERLTRELKEVHEVHLTSIMEVGRKGDELLIQEKVKAINLEEKVTELQQRAKELEGELQRRDKAKEPLQNEIKKQQALIKHYITWEQVQAFEQQEGNRDV